MQIHLIAIGKCRDKAILDLVNTYAKRLKPFASVKITELNAKSKDPKTAQKEETDLLLKACPKGSFIMALDERGKQFSSQKFAQKIKNIQEDGFRDICLLIGGADGHTEHLRTQAQLLLGLSEMTLPHMLVRPVLMEQLYRAYTLISGHPYHRD